MSINNYFNEKEFLNYLSYLQYFKQLDYLKFITYSRSIIFLDLLQYEFFRQALKYPGFINYLNNKIQEEWLEKNESPQNNQDNNNNKNDNENKNNIEINGTNQNGNLVHLENEMNQMDISY